MLPVPLIHHFDIIEIELGVLIADLILKMRQILYLILIIRFQQQTIIIKLRKHRLIMIKVVFMSKDFLQPFPIPLMLDLILLAVIFLLPPNIPALLIIEQILPRQDMNHQFRAIKDVIHNRRQISPPPLKHRNTPCSLDHLSPPAIPNIIF
jgi:hypothetical protein